MNVVGLSIIPLLFLVPQDRDFSGGWEGYLNVGGQKLRMIVKFEKQKDSYKGALDIPDQGVIDLGIDKVEAEGDTLRLTFKAMKAVYEGKWTGNAIEGLWKQGGQSFPLAFKKLDRVPSFAKPQEPKKPYPYREEDVSFSNNKAKIELAGTLTLPQGKGPFPGVVLVSGSGPQDRNEALMGHKPFLVLADHLTRRGIAVLRYDDRGVGKSTGVFSNATTRDFAGDTRSAVAFLRGRSDIRANQIGIIGHSEGGLIAPMVAIESKDVAFIVLMAGPGVTGEKIILLQAELIFRAQGATKAQTKRQRDTRLKLFKIVRTEKDRKVAEKKVRAVFRELLATLTPEERKQIGDPEKYIDAQIRQYLTMWWKFFLAYDPAPTLVKLRCPVLALFGEKDLQVPPHQSTVPMAEAFKQGGHKDFTIAQLPDMNHLFQTCKTGSPTEYSAIQETIAPLALRTISDWILARTSQK